MSRAALLVILLVLAGNGPIRAEEEPPPEPIGTAVREVPGSTIHEAILPGEVVDWTVIPEHNGSGSVVLLLEMEEERRQVFRWSLTAGGGLEEVGAPLPDEVETLLTLAEEDGSVAVLVAEEGLILGLSEDGEWKIRYESAYDVFPLRDTRGAQSVIDDELVVRSVGLLQGLGRDPETRELQAIWRFDLPLRVDREWGGLRLDTPPIMAMDWAGADGPQWILGPEPHGKRRVKTVLLAPAMGDGGFEMVETWSLLPSAEDLEESWYVEYNGATALIVTSVLAEKHGVFEKKKLRLFELSADRTRSGSQPLLEVITKTRNWYDMCAGIADLNGDGVDDLVSAQPKGLGAGSLWVEGHIAQSTGGFEPKTRGSEIKLEEVEICSLAIDIDGDLRVDLVAVESDALLVFPLIQSPDSKVVVSDNPQWRVKFHDIDGRPSPVEILDAPGSQILVTGRTEGKRQAVRIVHFK